MSAIIPTDEQLRAWAREQLRESRFMYLNADLLRVLIHHVRDAAVAEHRATLLLGAKRRATDRERAKEKAWINLELTEDRCSCGNVGYFGLDQVYQDLWHCTACGNVMCASCARYGYCKDCDEHIGCCKACVRTCVNTECSKMMCIDCANDGELCFACANVR